MMIYEAFAPPAPIARHIESGWLLRAGVASLSRPIRLLPDGRVELVIQVDGGALRRHGAALLPRAFVVGQMTRSVTLCGAGDLSVIGLRLRPAGAHDLLRMPMAELVDRVAPLDALTPDASRLVEDAQCARAGAEQVHTVFRWAQRRLEAGSEAGAGVMRTADAMLRAGGQLTLDAAASIAGVGRRQLERRFVSAVGLGPKTLCRVARFANVVTLAQRAERPAWARIAADCGYCDQAHLVREFRRFAGESPARGEAARDPARHWCSAPVAP